MKNAYLSRLVFFAFNQFAIICYLGFMAAQNDFIQQNSFVHFLLLSFLIFDAEYISYKNVKGNKTLNHFSLLLLLLGWQFLLYLFDFRPISDIVSTVLLPYLLLSVDLFCTGILISRICLPRAKTASCLFENFLYHSCILLLCFGSCFFCSLSAASPSFNRDPYHRGHHAEKADHVCSKKPMEANTFFKCAGIPPVYLLYHCVSQKRCIFGKPGELYSCDAYLCQYP